MGEASVDWNLALHVGSRVNAVHQTYLIISIDNHS
jgi:hypothetical protein